MLRGKVKIKKLLLVLSLVIVALLAPVLAWAFLTYPSDYVLRVLRWGNADVYDYHKLPERVVAEYLQEKIWLPLDMEYDASWSLDENGFEKMESGINARAIDFAKFGRLYLNNGFWEDRQVVPQEWVRESTQPAGSLPDGYYPDSMELPAADLFYKYLWWDIQRDETRYDFAARGNHGQFIYVSPDKNLVIVRNCEKYCVSFSDWMSLFYQFADTIPVVSGQ